MAEQLSKKTKLEKHFIKFADFVDGIVGSPYWFGLSVFIVLLWFFSGFFVGFGDTWQLLINTTTTILTFLMISLLHTSETKWEERIEKLEEKEVKDLKEIEKETKKMIEEATKNASGNVPQK